MVEDIVGSQVGHLQLEAFLPQMSAVIASFYIARQRRGAMVAGIETQAATIVGKVELIVLVGTFHLGWIDSQRGRDSPVGAADAHGSLEVGAQVGLGTDAVLISPHVEVVARLVQPHLQRQSSFGSYDIVRVIGCLIISLREHTIDPRSHLLVVALRIGLI